MSVKKRAKMYPSGYQNLEKMFKYKERNSFIVLFAKFAYINKNLYRKIQKDFLWVKVSLHEENTLAWL